MGRKERWTLSTEQGTSSRIQMTLDVVEGRAGVDVCLP